MAAIARLGVIFGLLLCGLSLLAMVQAPAKSPPQFIPLMLGIPILFCGVVALNPHRRQRSTQVAMAIAVVGAVAGAWWTMGGLVERDAGEKPDLDDLRCIAAMGLLCAVWAAICASSLVAARRRRAIPPAGRSPGSRNNSTPRSTAAQASSRETA